MITFDAPARSQRQRFPAVTRCLSKARTLLRWPWSRDVVAAPCELNWERDTALLMAMAAAEQGEWSLVEAELLRGGSVALNDAACLNLLGLAAEVRGDWPRAKRMYGRAMRRDRSYLPAEMNMRRYFELFTLGRSAVPKCLGPYSPGTVRPAQSSYLQP
jgi:hypothetical protein